MTNVENSSNIADHEMDLTRQFIKNKIIFQHMVSACWSDQSISYVLIFRFTFWMIQIYDKREIIIIWLSQTFWENVFSRSECFSCIFVFVDIINNKLASLPRP